MTTPDPDIEAADWFAKRRDAGNRETLEPAFQAWRRSSERNREAYRRVEQAWGLLHEVESLGLLEALTGELRPAASRRSRKSPPPAVSAVLMVFALLAAVVALFGHHFTQDERVSSSAPFWVTYETSQYDSIMSVVLPDKSTLKLNSDTELKVRQSTARREIVLERGEVEFTIAPEASRPFEVTAGKATVRVLGTVFAMQRCDNGDVETVVSRGRVVLVPPSYAARELASGQAAQVSGEQVAMEKPLAAADDERLAWLRDKLVFGAGEPLWKIVRKFNRYNREQLKIVDPSIENLMIGGIFDKHDPETFAFGLSQLHVRYVISKSEALHSNVILLSRERP
jgi:transmembrane sensor